MRTTGLKAVTCTYVMSVEHRGQGAHFAFCNCSLGLQAQCVQCPTPYICVPSHIACRAVMLREGRLPGRSFQRLLSGEQQQLAGFVMGESSRHQSSPQYRIQWL
jgi:hypothetical protein